MTIASDAIDAFKEALDIKCRKQLVIVNPTGNYNTLVWVHKKSSRRIRVSYLWTGFRYEWVVLSDKDPKQPPQPTKYILGSLNDLFDAQTVREIYHMLYPEDNLQEYKWNAHTPVKLPNPIAPIEYVGWFNYGVKPVRSGSYERILKNGDIERREWTGSKWKGKKIKTKKCTFPMWRGVTKAYYDSF